MRKRASFGTARQKASAGFTLIEILTVIAIISILMVFLVPKGIEAMDKAKVTACKMNLQEIYKGLILYEDLQNNNPKLMTETGVRFFLKLWKYNVWEHTEQSAKKLTCPGLPTSELVGIQGRKYEEWYDDWENLDGTFTSYAGRDTKQEKARNLKSGHEPLVCDDNELRMNHRDATNVLMGDGSVKELNFSIMQIEGLVDKSETVLSVGPDSPHELLRKFILD